MTRSIKAAFCVCTLIAAVMFVGCEKKADKPADTGASTDTTSSTDDGSEKK